MRYRFQLQGFNCDVFLTQRLLMDKRFEHKNSKAQDQTRTHSKAGSLPLDQSGAILGSI